MTVEPRKIGTRTYPPELVFIKDRCDESPGFSSRIIWDSVREHYWWNPWKLKEGEAPFRCTLCQSEVFPCDVVKQVLTHYSGHEDFEPKWLT